MEFCVAIVAVDDGQRAAVVRVRKSRYGHRSRVTVWVSPLPESLPIEPGTEASIEVTVRNDSEIVDEYALQLLGDTAEWSTVEPDRLRLMPGDSAKARLTFRPPRETTLGHGPRPIGLKVASLERALDTNAERNPGRPRGMHRLNRAEYGNAVRDLLDLDIDVTPLLPADDSSFGFDKLADVLGAREQARIQFKAE